MKSSRRNSLFCALLMLLGSVLSVFNAAAQVYPTGPVKLIVPTAAGGAVDVIARIVAEYLRRSWNQPVLVVNHPGAGGAIGVRAAGTLPSDGSTLYFAISSNFVALPEMQATMPYDVARDFAPIGFVGESPMVIGASPALGVNSLAELIALAHRRPNELNLAVLSRGGLPHLTGELLRSRSGADMTVIHYPGAPQALTDLFAERVHLAIESLPAFSGAIAGGSLQALAVASPHRLPNIRDLPTVAETLPGFTATGWTALMAPPGTPESITRRISNDLRTILAQPEFIARLIELGTYTQSMSPSELAEFIQRQQLMWKPV